MKVKFICEKHEETGEKGWRKADEPGFDPLGGMGVAHDVLEHFADSTDSPADEFQALGASFFVRREHYYHYKYPYASFGRTVCPGENVASGDLVEIANHIIHERMPLAEPPATRKTESDAEPWIANFIKEATASLPVNMGMEDGEPDELAELKEIIRKAAGWLRIGYRRAARRFKDGVGWCPEDRALGMFMTIEREAAECLKHAEIGDSMTVHFCIRSGKAECLVETAY